jgi:hypothetical protein
MTPMERFLRLDDRFPENLYSRVAYKERFVFGGRRTMLQVLIRCRNEPETGDLAPKGKL